MNRIVDACPVCGERHLVVERVRCSSCGTAVEGKFTLSRLGHLAPEHQEFIEVFIKNRGNIKDVERELGISYPTVRNRLNAVIKALGYKTEEEEKRRMEILEALERGEMKPEEAVEALKQL
ncbi:MAG: DUF2089 domain-containing protein [bacterium]